MLTTLDHLPAGLLDLEAEQLSQILEGSTLIHLTGQQDPPLFVSVLLHGNEDTGWLAIRQLLRRYQEQRLPRSLSLFIGNVEAARHRLRHLDHQPDFNRIWQGGDRPEHHMAGQVLDQMRQRGILAAIDVHNNTGRNPHYSCVSHLEDACLQLASLFDRKVLYLPRPAGLLARAFGELGPTIGLECGLPHLTNGTQHAHDFLEQCLQMDRVPAHPVDPESVDLLHTVAVVKVPDQVRFGFAPPDDHFPDLALDLVLRQALDDFNFREIPADTVLGWAQQGIPLEVKDALSGADLLSHYFYAEAGQIKTAIPLMPGMLTQDERGIRQDCLCYLMERYISTPERGGQEASGVFPRG